MFFVIPLSAEKLGLYTALARKKQHSASPSPSDRPDGSQVLGTIILTTGPVVSSYKILKK